MVRLGVDEEEGDGVGLGAAAAAAANAGEELLNDRRELPAMACLTRRRVAERDFEAKVDMLILKMIVRLTG